ncbi:hypothetical protein ARMSODRAFT_981047 [Armillaria solidipes]|uniref:Uncharacterized protein n=1 Tax=Armillaria solidipes TaxID=1076256 RepID=A0A2H3ATI7_9AGAR|nr:hypothetical protein ARMSODRAFT_981047 [Armillaria solidipes]
MAAACRCESVRHVRSPVARARLVTEDVKRDDGKKKAEFIPDQISRVRTRGSQRYAALRNRSTNTQPGIYTATFPEAEYQEEELPGDSVSIWCIRRPAHLAILLTFVHQVTLILDGRRNNKFQRPNARVVLRYERKHLSKSEEHIYCGLGRPLSLKAVDFESNWCRPPISNTKPFIYAAGKLSNLRRQFPRGTAILGSRCIEGSDFPQGVGILDG